MLTTNTIALWLARNVDDEFVEIKNTRLSEVARAEASGISYRFCTSKASCEDVIAVFDDEFAKDISHFGILTGIQEYS